MRIVTYKRIKEFTEKHAASENALNFWYHTIRAKEWTNLNNIRQTFNSVDYIGNNRYVFIFLPNENPSFYLFFFFFA